MKIRYILTCLCIFYTGVVPAKGSSAGKQHSSSEQHASREQPSRDTVDQHSMSLDQFDRSLHIDKHDLDLDQALNINLSSEIDTVDSETIQLDPPSLGTNNFERDLFQESLLGGSMQLSKNITADIDRLPDSNNSFERELFQNSVIDKAQEQAATQEELIEFNFEDADLENLVTQMSILYNVTFVSDDTIEPLPKEGKAVKGNKISFKTNKPLTKKEAWSLFLSFLDIAGFTLVPDANPKVFRIVATAAGKKSPLPTYIGVDPEDLPDSDQVIRYLYFIKNGSLDTIKSVLNDLRSSASTLSLLKDLNAFVITDKSYNIKSLMNIVSELDRVSIPQAMSVLILQRANAEDVKNLYESITQTEDEGITSRLFPARKQPTALYFPENTRIIAEPRRNALILLGTPEAIRKIEEFIIKYIDVELNAESRSPLRVYQLKYADAENVAKILDSVTQFGKSTKAGQVGGLRNGDKYLKNMSFIAEKETNQLIIKGDEDDYQKVKEIIAELDEAQPQVAIEVLIVSVNLNENKTLGAQLRNKSTGASKKKANFQTSGLTLGVTPSPIVVNKEGSGATRLLGDLISLVTGASAGNTILSLGNDVFGVWGIFNVLQTIGNFQVVSNPFLTATNKQPAEVSVGESRRVVSANVVGGSTTENSFADSEAKLTVKVTPQINSDGMIVLDLVINLDEFIDPNPNSATQNKKEIKTTTIVADNEVLALGGLIRNKTTENTSRVPILGDIPILGWFFKNKKKEVTKDSLLILISSRIIPAEQNTVSASITQNRIDGYYGELDQMKDIANNRDPIHRSFFEPEKGGTDKIVEDLIFKNKTQGPSKKKLSKSRNKRKRAESLQANARSRKWGRRRARKCRSSV